ncbi:MAG: HDOD domain-containing protein [Tepidiformaceae bacterium]
MGRDASELLEEIHDLPVVPAVAMRVLQFAQADSGGAAELAAILSTDPALSAKLIKISNSAYYGFTRHFGTVREAVIVLGFKQVRQVAVAASIVDAFKKPRSPVDGFDLNLFWGHSLTVAIISEFAARKFNAGSPADAFTAGILHDVGRLALRLARPYEFGRALEFARTTGQPLRDIEPRETGYSHDEVGYALAQRWNFPPFLADAIGSHHDETLDTERDGIAAVIAMADQLALHFGINSGYEGQARPAAELPPELANLEVACGGMDSMLARAHAFIESVTGAPERWFTLAA